MSAENHDSDMDLNINKLSEEFIRLLSLTTSSISAKHAKTGSMSPELEAEVLEQIQESFSPEAFEKLVQRAIMRKTLNESDAIQSANDKLFYDTVIPELRIILEKALESYAKNISAGQLQVILKELFPDDQYHYAPDQISTDGCVINSIPDEKCIILDETVVQVANENTIIAVTCSPGDKPEINLHEKIGSKGAWVLIGNKGESGYIYTEI